MIEYLWLFVLSGMVALVVSGVIIYVQYVNVKKRAVKHDTGTSGIDDRTTDNSQ